MENTVFFEGEVNGVKVNTVEEYNKLITEHINSGTLESASSSTRVEEQEKPAKTKVVFEGEVNGVKVNTVEEYNKLITEHINSGTLESASSSTRVEEQDDDTNPLNQFVDVDPKFNRLLDIIVDTLGEKYLDYNGKLTRDFYKGFHSELKKLAQDEDNRDVLSAIAEALDNMVIFYDQVWGDYAGQVNELKQKTICRFSKLVNNVSEYEWDDLSTLVEADERLAQIEQHMTDLITHMKSCSRWADWSEYMRDEIDNKL